MRYGLPYQGSKNKIAPWVLEHLPQADTLVDLFAGGCAVTHCAMLSGMFERIIANDITDSVTLFQDALDGKYENESRWISREDFMRLKDTDPYVRIVWSFGNNQEGYLYSRDIESYKKAVHEMIFAETPNERRLKFKQVIREMEALGVISGGGDRSSTCKERKHSIGSSRLPPPNAIAARSHGAIRDYADFGRMQSLERLSQINEFTNATI